MATTLSILAIGRLKAGAEMELVERYVERAKGLGRNMGFTLAARDFPESPAASPAERMRREGEALAAAVPAGAFLVVLDERGTELTSEGFAARLASLRDGGRADICFLIGGADGLDPALAARADLRLAFGRMTWPHQLVRAMLAEQVYRALAILAGHPYHRA